MLHHNQLKATIISPPHTDHTWGNTAWNDRYIIQQLYDKGQLHIMIIDAVTLCINTTFATSYQMISLGLEVDVLLLYNINNDDSMYVDMQGRNVAPSNFEVQGELPMYALDMSEPLLFERKDSARQILHVLAESCRSQLSILTPTRTSIRHKVIDDAHITVVMLFDGAKIYVCGAQVGVLMLQ